MSFAIDRAPRSDPINYVLWNYRMRVTIKLFGNSWRLCTQNKPKKHETTGITKDIHRQSRNFIWLEIFKHVDHFPAQNQTLIYGRPFRSIQINVVKFV